MMIRVWVYDGILASGVASPLDVFATANALAARRIGDSGVHDTSLRWSIESLDGNPVRTASGQMVSVDRKITARAKADAVLLTAPFVADIHSFLADVPAVTKLTNALQAQHERGAVVASYCTGNYILAEAGLLDGKRATTHWANAKDFSTRYPRVELRSSEILTEQDGILCAGGVTSYLNLAIGLVQRFMGPDIAAATAKLMLIDTNRVSQASYATLLDEHGHSDRLVAEAQRRMEASLGEPLRLPDLAAQLCVSERTLNRRFKQALEIGPLEYLQNLRIEVAKRLLEHGTLSVEAACSQVGYADVSTFRTLFKRKVGISPREYQDRFRR